MQDCPHIQHAVDFQAAKDKLTKPMLWCCEKCQTSDSVHVCLTCGHMGCGRYISGHALGHYESSGHSISMSLCSKGIHCYICNDYTLNLSGETNRLQQLLIDLEDPKITRSGKIILPEQ